jgi:hypothetical protein
VSGAVEEGEEADEAFAGMVARMDMPPHARAVSIGRGQRIGTRGSGLEARGSGSGIGTVAQRAGHKRIAASFPSPAPRSWSPESRAASPSPGHDYLNAPASSDPTSLPPLFVT